MLKVNLIYGYSPKNAGDFAITLGAIDVLRSCGVKIRLFSRYNRENKDFFESEKLLTQLYGDEIELIESPFNLDRKDGVLKTIRSYVDGAMSVIGLKRNSDFRKALLDCDLLIFNGGNLFRCSSFIDFARLKALMFPLELVLGKRPIIIFPQSASKINELGRNVLFPILKEAEMVFMREKESFYYLSELTSNRNFYPTIDLAFFIDKHKIKIIERFRGRIAITLRGHTVGDISEFNEKTISHICNELARVVNRFGNDKFLIVVQTEKDIQLSKRLSNLLDIETYETHNPVELLSLYKSVKMLIGMRLHSIILALSVGTPCYGIFYKEWGLKNPGMMERFSMPFHFMDGFSCLTDCELQELTDLSDNRELHSAKILKIVDGERNVFMSKLLEVFERVRNTL